MTSRTEVQVKTAKSGSLGLLIALTAISLVFWDAPGLAWLIAPVKTFVTALHELGHASVCVLTGGTVTGLTIVSDNQGHGGLTMCRGGWPLLYTQAGYLGTAAFGCLFIFLGRYRSLSRAVLTALGAVIVLASVVLMSRTVFGEGRVLEGLMSVGWGLAIGAGLVWAGLKLPMSVAQLLLLFLAVQTALNAVTDVTGLMLASTGLVPGASFSDATTMAGMTFIPALFWSFFWALASAAMLGATIWWCYLRRPQGTKI